MVKALSVQKYCALLKLLLPFTHYLCYIKKDQSKIGTCLSGQPHALAMFMLNVYSDNK